MTVPMEGENPLLKLADNIGIQAPVSKKDKEWTPDQPPPITQRDTDQSAEAFMFTFGGRAAGGKGITGPNRGAPVAQPVVGKYGYWEDGSPKDIMELTPEERKALGV